jgi:glyoxylase-like metal-dependent hydrolase (beta-lactamase superfamily II)
MLSEEIAPGVAWYRTNIANVYFVGAHPRWVIIDTATPGYTGRIRAAAEERFGSRAKPAAILLTHGHFDHAGSARELAEEWDVPVYAHHAERPFLTGQAAYPPKDPTVGGCMGFLSRLFPTHTTNVGEGLQDLPPGGVVPGLEDWTWYHTPGHAPGHVSFFHQRQSILVAGDAITTVDLDSCRALLSLRRRICRPPAPFTFDWEKAHRSVELLARLGPTVVCAGHGAPMQGPEALEQLVALAENFPIPQRGRYSRVAARTDESGVVFTPPPVPDRLPAIAAGVGAAAFLGTAIAVSRKRRGEERRQAMAA